MIFQDTIAAIATASLNGGVSIIRISGKEAISKANQVLKFKKGQLIEFASHTVHYGNVIDNKNEVIDEVIVLIMKGPNSYTREDVVEIQCHGGAFVCQQILEVVLSTGICIAQPGEFTKRAFLNGRIDLSQAEAVMDLIESKSKLSLQNSIHQLSGIVKDKIINFRQIILDDVAFIEAALDDPEHISMDGFLDTFCQNVEYCINELSHLIDNYKNGKVIREGIQTVIIGRPNVGKSSFLNTILGVERAIVTDVPGTTRDTLEEDARIGDVLLHLIDTAGIHETDDKVEKIGIEKAKRSLNDADFCILVIDGSTKLTAEDMNLLNDAKSLNSVVLLNKNDLSQVVTSEDIRKYIESPIISFSSINGDGLDELESYIKKQFFKDKISFNDEIYITNQRQKQAVTRAYEDMLQVKNSIDLQMGEDFYTIDLMSAYKNLGEIIGESVDDDLVDTIFKKFCMGK